MCALSHTPLWKGTRAAYQPTAETAAWIAKVRVDGEDYLSLHLTVEVQLELPGLA